MMCTSASPAAVWPPPDSKGEPMVTIATPASPPTASRPLAATSPRSARALSTLVRRRFALSVRTPRELLVPLLTPVLFALVIAPALADQVTNVGGIDYMSFVAIATVGLLLPLSCMSAGIGVLVGRAARSPAEHVAGPA